MAGSERRDLVEIAFHETAEASKVAYDMLRPISAVFIKYFIAVLDHKIRRYDSLRLLQGITGSLRKKAWKDEDIKA